MTLVRRHLLRDAGALGLLATVDGAWAACGPTAEATEGPFYVSNAPALVDINAGRAPGRPMRLGGTVFSQDGTTPVPGARVEIWHCDAEGLYHPDGHGDIAHYRRGEINLRGMATTDAAGRFVFTSIVPGHYGPRRRHVHWKVAAPGHRALTTQSYWIDERGSLRDRADLADRVDACRWVAFRDEQGTAVGAFDIVLARA